MASDQSGESDYGYLGIEDSQTMMDLDMTDLMNPMVSEVNYPCSDITFNELLGSWAENPHYLSSGYTLDESEIDAYSSNLDATRTFRSSSQTSPAAIIDHPSIIAGQESWPMFHCNSKMTSVYSNTAAIHLQGLEQTLTSDYDWSTCWDVPFDPSPEYVSRSSPLSNSITRTNTGFLGPILIVRIGSGLV